MTTRSAFRTLPPTRALRLASFLSKAGSKHSKFSVQSCRRAPKFFCFPFSLDYEMIASFCLFCLFHVFMPFLHFPCLLVFIVKVVETLSIGSRLHPNECTPCLGPVVDKVKHRRRAPIQRPESCKRMTQRHKSCCKCCRLLDSKFCTESLLELL